eukprot:CAMPEP_0197436144 /NCGR_PEP_ID=MMETSP1175-20131217/3620_1 /TAXON_ID=1003142 /ORGANISM="Triceratium dubium, Strain CCMP147" /LENGTH=439 /DNA_ID=CAMNT_0042965359 /DNA_START=238 /DNA_END=1554 /DNA_ORIENTATION=-
MRKIPFRPKTAPTLVLALFPSLVVQRSCEGWSAATGSLGLSGKLCPLVRAARHQYSLDAGASASSLPTVPAHLASCHRRRALGCYGRSNPTLSMIGGEGKQADVTDDAGLTCSNVSVGKNSVLLWAGRNFVAGASLANERFLATIYNCLKAILPPILFAAGAVPLTAYSLVSPSTGVSVSKWIAKFVLSSERVLYSAVALPIVLLFSYLVNILSAVALSLFGGVVAQAWIMRDVWNGTAHMLTYIFQTFFLGTSELFDITDANGSNLDSSPDPLSSTGSLVSKEMESASGLFTVLVYMPFMEEVLFRGVLYGGCACLLHRILALSDRTDELNLKEDCNLPSGPKQQLGVLSRIDRSVALATSAMFSAVHIHNETGRLRGLLHAAAEGTLTSLEFVRLVCLYTTMVAVSVSATFWASLTIMTPAFNSHGLWGSIGAHIMW